MSPVAENESNQSPFESASSAKGPQEFAENRASLPAGHVVDVLSQEVVPALAEDPIPNGKQNEVPLSTSLIADGVEEQQSLFDVAGVVVQQLAHCLGVLVHSGAQGQQFATESFSLDFDFCNRTFSTLDDVRELFLELDEFTVALGSVVEFFFDFFEVALALLLDVLVVFLLFIVERSREVVQVVVDFLELLFVLAVLFGILEPVIFFFAAVQIETSNISGIQRNGARLVIVAHHFPLFANHPFTSRGDAFERKAQNQQSQKNLHYKTLVLSFYIEIAQLNSISIVD